MLQHLVEYYHAQTKLVSVSFFILTHKLDSYLYYFWDSYFHDGLKTIEHFGNYVTDLSLKLQQVRLKQDEERKRLNELRQLLRSAPGLEKEVSIHFLSLSNL